MYPPSTWQSWRFYGMTELFFLMKQNILFPLIFLLPNMCCDSKIIFDDNLIYSNYIVTLFHYFSCAAKVFIKYQLSFKWNKYYFFLPRIEYVRHELIADSTCSTQYKFQLIKEWPLPSHNISLLSFIDLCYFTALKFHGLNPTWNLFVVFNVFKIVKVYDSFHCCFHWLIYLKVAKQILLPHLFSYGIIVRNLRFLK